MQDLSLLSDKELCEVILGKPKIVEALFEKFGSMAQLKQATIKELMTIEGVGEKKATQIKGIVELGKRLHQSPMPKRVSIDSTSQLYAWLKDKIGDKRQEHFVVIALNSKNEILAWKILFIGTVTQCAVYPRDIFQFVLQHNAARFIVAHNHPSGHPKPSQDDINFTRKLIRASQVMEIELLDHLIVSAYDYQSLRRTDIWGLWSSE